MMSYIFVPRSFDQLAISIAIVAAMALAFAATGGKLPQKTAKQLDWREATAEFHRPVAAVVAVFGAVSIVAVGLKASVWLVALAPGMDEKPVRWVLLFVWLLVGAPWGIRLYRLVRGWRRPKLFDGVLGIATVGALCALIILNSQALA